MEPPLLGDSWTHLLARRLVRPLVGTGVTPNHLTTLRLVSGLAACAAFAIGSPAALRWGGLIWLVSAFLDRADGELARVGNMASEQGHLYDLHVDNVVSASLFVAIGIGLRHSWLGGWSIALGLLTGGSLLLCNWWSELLERQSPPNTRAYAGRWGFDPDDALYLMAAFAWLGWFAPILVASSIATPIIAVITGFRLVSRLRERPARTTSIDVSAA
jgi:archaetidylinositol phosphate synthase